MANGRYRRRPQIILSASQDLSDEVLAKVKAHCRILSVLGDAGATSFSKDSATEVAWRDGGRVIALPANPRTARSFSGDVWLDEYAYHQDAEGIRDAAFPIAMRGDWQVRVFSTPNGALGLFHDWATRPPPGWAVHRTTIHDAIRDGLHVNMPDLWAMCGGDERLFSQWFECGFLDADLQYIPTDLVDVALAWSGQLPEDLHRAEIHAGLDIGRTRDLTALALVAHLRGFAWVLAVMTWKSTDFATQRKNIDAVRAEIGWRSLNVDAGGLGTQFTEELVERYGEEVVPVHFTMQSKEDLVTRALRYFRDGRIRFPRDETGKALRDETIALRRKVTANGNILYDIPRSAGGHGDRFWAVALALKGAQHERAIRDVGRAPLFAVA